jgi:hypothetical protein
MRQILFLALSCLLLSYLSDVVNAKARKVLTNHEIQPVKDVAQPRTIVTGPLNIALVTGEQGRLDCASDRTADLNWDFHAHDSDVTSVLVSACVLNPAFTGIYAVERTGTLECRLIILSASFSRAGLYTCHETAGFDPVASAEVVVIEAEPHCYQRLETDGVLENEIVTFVCEVNYTRNLSPLEFSWTDGNGNPANPVGDDCFTRAVNISTVVGLFVNGPNENDPPRKFYFGYLAGFNDVLGTLECERRCSAQPLCYSYTFISNSHPDIVRYGECMGRNNDVDIHEPYHHGFSGSRDCGGGDSSTIRLQARPPGLLGYRTRAVFDQPAEVPDRASNVPDYTFEWAAPDVMVMYCPTAISITYPGTIMYVGQNLTCQADGYPEPSYEWYDYQTGERPTGKTITLTEEGYQSYLCNASVVIRGQTCFRVTTRDITVIKPGYPLNIAVEAGTTTQLDCKYGPTDINWIWTPAGQVGGLNIVIHCEVIPGVLDFIDVDPSDGGCGLILLSTQAFHGGHFTCQESSLATIPSASEVIILETGPQCTFNTTDGEVDEGGVVRMSCKIEFTGNMRPHMAWRVAGGPEFDGTTNMTARYLESHIDITATPPILATYFMRLYFEPPPPPQPPFVNNPALNAPDYERTVVSPLVRVRYCPRTTTISTGVIYVGDNLTCTSDSYPVPIYEWIDLDTNEIHQGQVLRIETEGQHSYMCVASTTVSGSSCSDSATFSFNAISTEPRNVAAVTTSDDDVTIYCRRPPAQVSWSFTGVDQGLGVTVVSGCKVVPALAHLYSVDDSHGGCNLILTALAPSQAGMYVCQDFESVVLPFSSALIVLHSEPDCRTNVTSVMPGDFVELRCSVGYTGHVAPHMTWTDSADQPIDSTDTVTDSNVESVIVLQATLPVIPSVACLTHFTTPPTMPPSLTTPATNIPPYTYVWNSVAVQHK